MIKILDDSLIDKIAAGEVVENPSSVVKELLENSIDAKSDKIEIEIREGGKSLIKIKDNGLGMSKEDSKLSIKRYATSKISNENDLFAIHTLGFRGEALASICAVSKFELISKQKGSVSGTRVSVEKKNIIIEECGAETGTTIIIKELFFNVPARKKFLKNIESETRAIIDIITRYALAYPEISFSLNSEGRNIIMTTKTNNWLNTIQSIYGTNIAKNMIEINHNDELLSIKGYIAKPNIARNDKLRQTIFLNGRYIKSKDINIAIKDGYHSTIFLEKEPVYILNINIDEKRVDVNVHPRKEIVKINNSENIFDKIANIIKENLVEDDLFLDSDMSTGNAKSRQTYRTEPGVQSTLNFEEDSTTKADIEIKSIGSIYENKVAEKEVNKIVQNLKESVTSQKVTTSHLGEFRIIGQLNKTYILIESNNGMIIVDQHAAEERVNYEKLMNELKDGAVTSQELLQPLTFELSPEEMQIVVSNKKMLTKTGYDIDEYGSNSVIVRSVPFIFERPSKVLIEELIEELKDNLKSRKFVNEIEEKITRFSCRKSIKAGKEMTFSSMTKLMTQLDKCEIPFTCPHGRPTIIRLSFADIEKKFKRTG